MVRKLKASTRLPALGRKTRVPISNGHPQFAATALPPFIQARLQERWRKYRKALKRSRKNYSEKSVHEFRIETRRMLALLELLHPFSPANCLQDVERKFKKVFDSSANLRDTQVQCRALEQELAGFPELAPFHKWLRRRQRRFARRFENTVRRGLRPKLKACVKDLRNWCRHWADEPQLAKSHSNILLRQLNTACERLVRLRNAARPNQPATIHRVRIAFKAYRYMVELLHPEILKVDQGYLSKLQSYQAMTGEIQDAEVLLRLLSKFQKAKPKRHVTSFRAELKRRYANLIDRFLAMPLPCVKREH